MDPEKENWKKNVVVEILRREQGCWTKEEYKLEYERLFGLTCRVCMTTPAPQKRRCMGICDDCWKNTTTCRDCRLNIPYFSSGKCLTCELMDK